MDQVKEIEEKIKAPPKRKLNPILTVVLIALELATFATIYVQITPRKPMPDFEDNFLGGVTIFFNDNVSESRMIEIASSVNGKVILKDIPLRMMVLRFNPPLKNLAEEIRIERDLKKFSEIKFTGPELSAQAN